MALKVEIIKYLVFGLFCLTLSCRAFPYFNYLESKLLLGIQFFNNATIEKILLKELSAFRLDTFFCKVKPNLSEWKPVMKK